MKIELAIAVVANFPAGTQAIETIEATIETKSSVTIPDLLLAAAKILEHLAREYPASKVQGIIPSTRGPSA